MDLVKRKGVKKQPLGLHVYELLKEKIITLEIPPGMKLEEQNLMDKLKSGRTIIREAIKMLIAERLVVSHGSNATYVKDMNVKSAKDVSRLVSIIGLVAFDMANPRDDFSGIIKKLESLYLLMDEAIHEGDTRAFVRFNADFHKTLAKVADNELLDEIIDKIYFYETRLAFLVSLSLGGKEDISYIKYNEKIRKQHRGHTRPRKIYHILYPYI